MGLIWKLGFRNLLRNKKRTILSSLAIGIGLAALIITDGFIIGMRQSMVQSLTNSYMGHAQIYEKSYRSDPDSAKVVDQLPKIRAYLRESEHIDSWTERVQAPGLLTSPANVLDVQVVGVVPDSEARISRLRKNLIEGEDLQGSQDILIGHKLAKKMDVQIGERVVLTIVQADSDEITQELMRVQGIFKFNMSGFDDGMVFLNRDKLLQMLALKDQVHEVVLKFKSLKEAERKSSTYWSDLSNEKNEMTSWPDLVPGVMAAFELAKASTAYVSIFLLAVVLLGIMNTLFMSIYERTYEFGVLQAVGTRPSMIFKTILAEAFFLGLFSGIVGILVAFFFGELINFNGIDYGGIEMAEATFTEPIYMIYRWQQFVFFPLELMMFTIIAAIYPSWHAAKMTIAEAMKKSL